LFSIESVAYKTDLGLSCGDSTSQSDCPSLNRRPLPRPRRARLVNAIARGRRWLEEIVSGSVTDVQQIATRQKCSARQVNMTISLAFLAPDLVRAAVEGRLPRGIGVERLRDAPAEWSQQFESLGLNPR
jgi:site-specific DNA recombinase